MFGKHHVTGVGGFEFTKRDYHSLNVQQHPVENEFIDLISTNDNNLVSENKAITSTASWVFRVGYDYETVIFLIYRPVMMVHGNSRKATDGAFSPQLVRHGVFRKRTF